MKFVSPSVAALAVALLAGCATPPEEGAGARGASAGSAGMADASIGNSGVPVAGSEQDLRQTAGERVFFATDTDALSAEAQATLRRQAAWLTRYPQVDVLIEGHADERGTRDYNLALGERRATSVKDHLVALGVASTRIQTVSYGKERPTCVAGTPACWQENRRAVTVLR
jgi:peptidoglycan-associated lipoprotein